MSVFSSSLSMLFLSSFPFSDLNLQICKYDFFSFFSNCTEYLFKMFGIFRVHIKTVIPAQKIIQSTFSCVLFFLIDPACGNPITYHFHKIIEWHLQWLPSAVYHVIPVFPVMSVSAFMVKPPRCESEVFLFIHVWRTGTLIIAHRFNKLGR